MSPGAVAAATSTVFQPSLFPKNQKPPPKHAMSAEKSCQKAILGLTMDTKVSLE